MVRKATQQDLDNFILKQHGNPDIFPYLNTTQYSPTTIANVDDWNGVDFIYGDLKGWLRIKIFRDEGNTFMVSLYAENNIVAGKLLKEIPALIKRYDPMAIKTSVHATNIKSLKINRKIFKEYGVEPKGAWNLATGTWEDLHLFKNVLR